jgi:shikimate dehydrogenase
MNISGHTKPYAVLGHPIGHTLSPVMHNAAFAALGMDAIYLAFDVAPERLMPVLDSLGDMGFGGVNLTVPLKETAFQGLSQLDESARLLGAVNTVQFTARGLVGHNTDGHGFLKAVEEAFGQGVQGASLFVLGAGGAGRAVALTAAQAGARAIALRDVEAGRADAVAAEIKKQFPAVAVTLDGDSAAADLVVQCTPIGMKPGDPSPLPTNSFQAGQRAFDLVYMHPETPFLAAARAAGARTANGLGMLLHQGARAFEIWTGRAPPAPVMRRALEEKVYGS